MPAVVSHYLLAERVYYALLEYQPQLDIDHTAFLWGACGADIFFLHRVMPYQKGRSLKKYGTELHNMSAEKIINYFIRFSRNCFSDTAMSYTLGFITHYAFDSTAHPFILHFADIMEEQHPEKLNSVCHNEIEANLDSLFLRYERKQKISSFRLQTASPLKENVNKMIAEMWHGLILAYFGEDIGINELIQVQKDWHYSLVLLNDKGAFKKHAVMLGERILGISPVLSPIIRTSYPDLSFDYANMSHTEWHSNADGRTHKENFFELADIAEEKSLALISSVLTNRLLTHEQCKESFTGK